MTEYTVQYNIKVFSEDAVKEINQFKSALSGLSKTGKNLNAISEQFAKFNKTSNAIGQLSNPFDNITKNIAKLETSLKNLSTPKKIDIDTSQASTKLSSLINLVATLKEALLGLPAVNLGGATSNRGAASASSSSASSKAAAAGAAAPLVAGGKGKTGHMPLERADTKNAFTAYPRSGNQNIGWLPETNRHYDKYPRYVEQVNRPLTGKQSRSLDKQVRQYNAERHTEMLPSLRQYNQEMLAAANASSLEQKRLDAYWNRQARTYNQQKYAAQRAENADYQRWLKANAAGPSQAEIRQAEKLSEAAARQSHIAVNREAIYNRNRGPVNMARAAAGAYPGQSAPPSYTPPRTATPSPFPTYPTNQRLPQSSGRLSMPSFGSNNMILGMMQSMGIMYGIQGVGALVKDIVEQATEYDNTMKTVESLLKSHYKGTDFSSEYGSMVSTVRNVGMETKYKVTEVADAAKFLAMAGLDVQAIKSAIRPVADVALVGDTELGETADVMTNIMTGYGIAPSQMRNAADVMTNTFTMTNTTLMEMAESLKYMGPIYGPSGVPFEEAAAAVGILGNAGLKGSQAGTTLRTIMANIMNPTKKMSTAWSELGIELKGKRLVDIFQELSDKQVPVEKFFKLFNRTAAQGAIALSQQVDTWNNVIAENFMSDGIAAELAEEKKNTIQGLWAQLTSVFTDDGVQAFDGLHNTIKGFLRDAIAWLKTDEAKKAIQDLFNTLSEFAKILVKVSETFYDLYNYFKPVLIPFMKLQLMIMPITKGLSMLSKVIVGFSAIKGTTLAISGLTASLFKLNAASTALATGGGRGMFSGPFGALGGGVTGKQMSKAAKGLNLNRPHASQQGYFVQAPTLPKKPVLIDYLKRPNAEYHYSAAMDDYNKRLAEHQNAVSWNQGVINARNAENKANWEQYVRDRKRYNRRLALAQAGNFGMQAGGMIAGMGLGALGAHELTKEDGSIWDSAAGFAYSAAGIAAMTNNPVGYSIAGIAALGGAVLQTIGYFKQLDAIRESYSLDAINHKYENGMDSNSSDKSVQLLQTIYDKNSDINDLIEKRLALKREELGLDSQQTDSAADAESYKTEYENLIQLGFDDLAKSGQDIYKKYQLKGGVDVVSNGALQNFVISDASGNSYEISNLVGGAGLGTLTGKNAKAVVAANLAAAKQFAQRGKTEGDDALKGVAQRTMQGGKVSRKGIDDIYAYLDYYEKQLNPANIKGIIRPDEFTASPEELQNASLEDKNHWLIPRQMEYQIFTDRLAKMREALAIYDSELQTGKFTEGGLLNMLGYVNLQGSGHEAAFGAVDAYTRSGIYGISQAFGIQNGQFAEGNGFTAEQHAQDAIDEITKIQQAMQNMGIATNPALESFNRIIQAIYNLAMAQTGVGDMTAATAEYMALTGYNAALTMGAASNQMVDAGVNMSYGSNVAALGVGTLGGWISNLGNSIGSFNWGSLWNSLIPPISGVTVGAPSTSQERIARWAQNPLYGTGALLMAGGNNKPNKPGGKKTNNYDPYADNDYSINSNTGGSKSNKKGGKKTNKPTVPTQKDYKSNYNNDSAAPKQVIVNISNLMNVDKVDLSKEDNKVAIANLKDQLSEALIDVVREFDSTWHG